MKWRMNRKTNKRLKAERARRMSEAARALLDTDNLGAAKENLAWIDASSQLMRSARQATQPKWTIVIGFCCVLVVALAGTLRFPYAHVSLEIESESVGLVLGEDWTFRRSLALDRVVLDGISAISAPGVNLEERIDSTEEVAVAVLQGGGVTLEELALQTGADVELGAKDNELQMFVKNSPVSGLLFVENAEIMIEIGDQRRTVRIATQPEDPPENVSFTCKRAGAAPAMIKLNTQERWQFSDMRVKAISFLEEYPPGSGTFESAIQAGKVTVLETRSTENLVEGDLLILEGVKSWRLRLSKTQNGVMASFEGSVSRVSTGPRGFEKNLKPTFLTYLYHQKPLAILWSAVAFLFVVIWRIRNAILS